jgi:hypothetical protein
MWDNLMTWDTEFQVQIENMENMETTNASPPEAAAHNLVGSVDAMYFMDRHASAESNNPRSTDASVTPHLHKSFVSQCTPPHMNPKSVTPARLNVYQAGISQPSPPINSDMHIARSMVMETFQLYIDDVKEDVHEINTGVQSIQQMIQHLIAPTSTVKTTVSTEQSSNL